MGKVTKLEIREKIYEYENCSGCQDKVNEEEQQYMEVVMPYNDYDKHILLCESCYKEAKGHGVL